jgi:predicted DsbA family dithiol-disulfide isomerase
VRLTTDVAAGADADAEHMRDASATPRRRPFVRIASVAALALVVVVAAIALGPGPEPEPAAPGPTSLFDGIPQDGIVLGSPTAPAVLTEFADLQCPFCAVFARDVLPAVVDRYVRTGRLRLELRVLAFLGEDSVRAGAMAAAATEQDRVWSFTDAFYRRQGRENSGYATDAFLRSIGAATPGLDVERAFSDRDRRHVLRRLGEAQEAANALGVDRTPAFSLRVKGRATTPVEPAALTSEAFVGALDQALGR